MNQGKTLFALLIGMFLLFTSSIQTADSNPLFDQDPRYAIAEERMLEIGRAIERLYEDKGVLLVDLFDDGTPEGQARLVDDFENVGNPTDRERTPLDVLQPLVHFGYLNEIPEDPFINENTDSFINSFVYVDEEDAIEGSDGLDLRQTSLNSINLTVGESNSWVLFTPGMDGTYFEENSSILDALRVTRYQVYMNPPYYELILAETINNLTMIGNAISRFHSDYGVFLIDHRDDDHQWGLMRLTGEFEGAGNVPAENRLNQHVLEPLVHFGYLEQLPVDPFINPYPSSNQVNQHYTYIDNDPIDEFEDYPDAFGMIEEGEWLLIGTKSMPNSSKRNFPFNLNNPLNADESLHISSRDFLSSAVFWECY